MHLRFKDLTSGYVELVNIVLHTGREVSPRGQRTLEIGPVTLEVCDPLRAVPLGVGRDVSLALGAAESCHLIGGVSDAAQLVSITKNMRAFVEGDRLRGAYGPRLHSQWPRVVETLARDRDSRQAGAVIWRSRDIATPSVDVPCTVELHFWIRDDRLNAHAFMRSNDIFWGIPYDCWAFVNAQVAIAKALHVEVGTYFHTAVSLHAYVDRDAEKLASLHWPTEDVVVPMLAIGLEDVSGDTPAARWQRIAQRAASIALDEDVDDMPRSFSWYRDQLANHVTVGDTKFCALCRYALPLGHFSRHDPDAFCDRCEEIAERAR